MPPTMKCSARRNHFCLRENRSELCEAREERIQSFKRPTKRRYNQVWMLFLRSDRAPPHWRLDPKAESSSPACSPAPPCSGAMALPGLSMGNALREHPLSHPGKPSLSQGMLRRHKATGLGFLRAMTRSAFRRQHSLTGREQECLSCIGCNFWVCHLLVV